jgi:hypothetical protein
MRRQAKRDIQTSWRQRRGGRFARRSKEQDMADEMNTPETFPKMDEGSHPETATAEPVKADTVNLTGSVQQVQARLVNVQQGGIGSVKAEELTVSVKQGGIGAMAANRIDATVSEGGIGAMAAKEATLNNSNVSVVAALKITGNPRVLFDLRAGLLAGVVAGATFGLVNFILRGGRK